MLLTIAETRKCERRRFCCTLSGTCSLLPLLLRWLHPVSSPASVQQQSYLLLCMCGAYAHMHRMEEASHWTSRCILWSTLLLFSCCGQSWAMCVSVGVASGCMGAGVGHGGMERRNENGWAWTRGTDGTAGRRRMAVVWCEATPLVVLPTRSMWQVR